MLFDLFFFFYFKSTDLANALIYSYFYSIFIIGSKALFSSLIVAIVSFVSYLN
jgi:hypothetical protein